MAYESFSVSELIPADPERIYRAWLDSVQHTAFTGEAATIEPFVGGKHTSFDGYAVGSTLELLPGQRIVQTWRATDFPPGSPDSRVEVTLEATVGGTMVTIFHTEIPSGQGDSYRDGWLRYYLEPLKTYFVGAPAAAAKAKANGVSRPTVAKAKRAARAKGATAKAKTSTKTKTKAKTKTARPKKAAAKTKGRARPKTKDRAPKPTPRRRPKPAPRPKPASKKRRS